MRKLIQITMAMIMMATAQASAAYELIMVEQQGCHYCERWKEEIGPIYPKTDVGMFAPIRMVDITNVDSTPEIANAVVFTPTFIITNGEREITRMEGYMSEDFFWGVLEMILERETEFKATGR
jgi:thioredoxin-related protein